ncbi:ataxin-7-like protein 3 [Lingula anatina]|uniref:SAGA-associated factor 11 homolog n=1 Tax=Lingula anatina TaxID=7574 RepID=A0A1S3HY45_LINAN|nr:ataxin-7-like protein 3 [Lingula anatina]|eukprot:XP_013390933.1 ataxin-7-like protein 3 [Lingula anatina]
MHTMEYFESSPESAASVDSRSSSSVSGSSHGSASEESVTQLLDDTSADLMRNGGETQSLASDVMYEILDEISLGLCFEMHRACKIGTFLLDATDEESQKAYDIVDERGLDVFGQVPSKKQFECVCPNCTRNMAASRFAPHLEKCMGMGRNSSRIASRRIANTGKGCDDDGEDDILDDDNDNDWSYQTDRKIKKLRKEKRGDSPRRSRIHKYKNGDIPSVGSAVSESSGLTPAYEVMTLEERKQLLLSTCGVISEHTRKMCTKSLRCPQHTDEQRQMVRSQLLGHTSFPETDDVQIDIDGFEDTDLLREHLQWEAVSNPSPADSTSTTNSNGSRKQRKHGGRRKKPGRSKSAANTGTPSSVYEFM